MYYFKNNIHDKYFCCVINHLTFKKYLCLTSLYFLGFKTTKYVRKQILKKFSDRPTLSYFRHWSTTKQSFFFPASNCDVDIPSPAPSMKKVQEKSLKRHTMHHAWKDTFISH